jgi:hypothetical protein
VQRLAQQGADKVLNLGGPAGRTFGGRRGEILLRVRDEGGRVLRSRALTSCGAPPPGGGW